MRRWIVAAGLLGVACEAPPPEPRAAPALTGRVVDGLTGAPLPGARVEVVGTLRATVAGPDGAFALPAPAGFGRLRATAPGHLPVEGPPGTLSLWPEHPDEALVAGRLAARPRRDDPDEPGLRPEARAFLLGRPTPRVPGVLRQGLGAPPATVRLYRRGGESNDGSCGGRVDVIPLEDYVRGVLPHEWIASWEPESLKAGAVAARTYAWQWIARGGKYQCADLDDTTRSQVYRDDTNPRTDAAVAATAGQAVVRNGDLVDAEYSAENGDPTAFGVDEPLCHGLAVNGHGRGMCQWGTQRWASQQGKDYVWMVEHYYPGATVSHPEPPAPRVELAQGLARPEPQPCPDPAGTYDCADFVPDGRSRGLFDLFVGQQVDLTVLVHNAGDGDTAPQDDAVVLAVDLPDGLLGADLVRVDTDLPARDGHTFQTDASQGDPQNPPADAPGGPSLRFRLHGLAAGETRRVTLRLRGAGYSVPTGGPARVRTWIASIADRYAKPAWDQPPPQNDGQTFNGGDLKLLTEFDVYAPDHWSWDGGDPALVEGWRARGGAAALTVEGGALRLEANGDDPGMESPYTHLDADRLKRLRVPADHAVPGRLYWRASGQDFAEDRSAPLTLGGDPLVLDGAPGWGGMLEQVRIDVDAPGVVLVDEVAFEPYTPPVPDAAVRDAAPPVADASPPDAGEQLVDAAPPADDAAPVPRPTRRVLSVVDHGSGCAAVPSDVTAPWWLLLFGPWRVPRRVARGRNRCGNG